MDSLVVIWEGLTAAVVMSNTIFRIHKKPRSLHGADYKRNEEFHHVVRTARRVPILSSFDKNK